MSQFFVSSLLFQVTTLDDKPSTLQQDTHDLLLFMTISKFQNNSLVIIQQFFDGGGIVSSFSSVIV
jgi:hypothetical protein